MLYNLSFIDLLNSDKGGKDRLDEAAFINRFVQNKDTMLSDRFLPFLIHKLKNLRSIFKNIIENIDNHSIEALNKHLSGYSFTKKLVISENTDKYRLSEQCDDTSIDSVVAGLAFSFAKIIDKGNLNRIRICNNPECSYYFYDTSKGNKKKWCSPTMCGNVMKVRSYRSRKKKK